MRDLIQDIINLAVMMLFVVALMHCYAYLSAIMMAML